MRTEFTFTLSGYIYDPQRLWDAAVRRLHEENAPAQVSDEDIADILGTREDPNISACVVELLDPGTIVGGNIDSSDCEY